MKRLISLIALLYAVPGFAQETFTIHFDFDKYALTEAARSQLDSFLLSNTQHIGNLSISLNGHCDAFGAGDYNDKLSKQRVAAVKKYFISNGLNAVNIGDEIGHGKREPLNKNRSEEERQLNRRVEISYYEVVRTYPPGVTDLMKKLTDSTTNVGSNIVLKNINFLGGSHQFLPSSKPMLEELLDAMKTYPKLVIRIEGHICCERTAGDGLDTETNLYNLSEARAKAIKDYLVENNIDPKRVSYKGFGHSAPLYPYPEQSEQQQIENRRVEIKIISK